MSAPNLLTGDDIAKMADRSIVFALANPDPEVDPREARKHAAVVATGRSDQPNQINNVLAFPGVFRGMLDAAAEEFTEEMALAAARAIADVVGEDKINPTVIVPSVFDPRVTPAVAAAIRAVVRGTPPRTTPPPCPRPSWPRPRGNLLNRSRYGARRARRRYGRSGRPAGQLATRSVIRPATPGVGQARATGSCRWRSTA